MRNRLLTFCGTLLVVAGLVAAIGCSDNTVDNGGGGTTGGGANITVTSATPTTGSTNISGVGVTVTKETFTGNGSGGFNNGVSYTSLIVRATTSGYQREVLVYFETSTGVLNAVSYSWGFANRYEHSVSCPATGCSGVVVETSAKRVTFTSTDLDNHGPGGGTTEYATLGGGIEYR